MESKPTFTPEEIVQERRMMGGLARKTGGGCLKGLLQVVGVLIVGVVLVAALDDMVAPWAWAFPPGRATLTGEWVGTFDLPAGQHGAVYLDLTHNANNDFRSGSRLGGYKAPLDGSAESCIGSSQAQHYTLSGGADASAANIGLAFGAQKPTVPGYAFQEMKGAWAGDTLTLSGVFTKILDAQGSTLSAEEPNQRQPTTIRLRRGKPADFKAACAPMGG